MNKINIIHCSDFHFDTPFRDFGKDIAEKRKEDIRETFGKIIRYAKDNKINIILMAGDIFDNSTVSHETISFMKRKFEEIPKTRIFISPGNHDPFSEKSYYNIIRWPENVYIFKKDIEKVDIEEWNVSIYGVGFSSNYERSGLLQNFSVEDINRINIMVMHGEFAKGTENSLYNPITEDEIAKTKLDYLALGHVHSFSGINKAENTYWSYCGCPEGRGFDELGPKGIVMGELGKSNIKLKFQETCKRRYTALEVDVSNSDNYDDIILKINQLLGLDVASEKVGNIYNRINDDIYKITLRGEIPAEFAINISVLEEKLKYHFYHVKVKDETEYKIDYEALAEEFTLRGIYVKKLLDRIKTAEDEEEIRKLKFALKLGLKAIESKEVK